MHATVRQDLILGLTLTAFFCMVYFVLIPLGIEVPRSHDPGQLSPAAYPSWIALAGLGASLLLAGLLFGRNFGRALHAAAELQNKTEHEGE